MYDAESVRLALAHHYNGGPWPSEFAPDADMPSVSGNPATRGTEVAAGLDVVRAFNLYRSLDADTARAVFLYCGCGLLWREVAVVLDVPLSTVRSRALHGIDMIAHYANAGLGVDQGVGCIDVQPPPVRRSQGNVVDLGGTPWLDLPEGSAWCGPVCPACHYMKSSDGWCECG